MSYILIGLSFMLIVEGLGPLLFPTKWKRYMQEMSEQPVSVLRRIGGCLVVVGGIGLYFLLAANTN